MNEYGTCEQGPSVALQSPESIWTLHATMQYSHGMPSKEVNNLTHQRHGVVCSEGSISKEATYSRTTRCQPGNPYVTVKYRDGSTI